MEDADSDSGIDSDGDWYHAGRDQLYGTRTDSTAVGPDGAHRRRFLCEEEKKGGTPMVGMPLFSVAKCRNRLAPAFLCRDNYRSWCKHSCQL